MKPNKSKYSILPQSNTRVRVRIASWLWLGILNCLALVIWHQSTEPKALSNSISGPAWVRDIEPCQGVLPGDGQVITATFLHSSGDVIDLVWSDDESRNLESVGTTSNHPFYSFDRGDYVQAGSLQEGERLLTYSGDTKRVVSKLARPGPETVYNLEVFGEHVYFIGHDGVLVHNSDSYGLNAGVSNRTAAGGIGDIPGAIPRNSGLPILKQSGPTCVANSCGMVLDQVAAGWSLTNLGKYRGVLSAEGVGLDQAASILNANGIGAVYREGITVRGLRKMVGLNKPAIVRIMTPDGGHAVIVDSFTKRMGKQVVSIRNPHGVEYYQPLNEFMKVFTGHAVKLQ